MCYFRISVVSIVVVQTYDDAVFGHTFQSAWSCLDLLEVLCQLAERGHASHVRSILENPLSRCPEILLLGMAHVNVQTLNIYFCHTFPYDLLFLHPILLYGLQTAYNLIQNEVASAVLPLVLKNASGNSLNFTLWRVNPNMLLRGLIDAMNLDPENISRTLDACQELKASYCTTLSFFVFIIGTSA